LQHAHHQAGVDRGRRQIAELGKIVELGIGVGRECGAPSRPVLRIVPTGFMGGDGALGRVWMLTNAGGLHDGEGVRRTLPKTNAIPMAWMFAQHIFPHSFPRRRAAN
jgi:hypothetical protein